MNNAKSLLNLCESVKDTPYTKISDLRKDFIHYAYMEDYKNLLTDINNILISYTSKLDKDLYEFSMIYEKSIEYIASNHFTSLRSCIYDVINKTSFYNNKSLYLIKLIISLFEIYEVIGYDFLSNLTEANNKRIAGILTELVFDILDGEYTNKRKNKDQIIKLIDMNFDQVFNTYLSEGKRFREEFLKII